MTKEDQAAAIGRLVQTYSEAKQKRAALVAECTRLASVLDDVARAIRGQDYRDVDELVKQLPDNFPEKHALASLLAELAATNKVLADSKRLMKDAGVNVA